MGHRAALAKIPAYKMRVSTCVSTGSCVCVVVVVMVAIGRFLLWLIFVHNYNHQNSDLMFCFVFTYCMYIAFRAFLKTKKKIYANCALTNTAYLIIDDIPFTPDGHVIVAEFLVLIIK